MIFLCADDFVAIIDLLIYFSLYDTWVPECECVLVALDPQNLTLQADVCTGNST